MQLYAVNFIPLLGSLYMFRVFYTPIIRSTIYNCIYSHLYKPQYRLSYLLPEWPAGHAGNKIDCIQLHLLVISQNVLNKLCFPRYYGQFNNIMLNTVRWECQRYLLIHHRVLPIQNVWEPLPRDNILYFLRKSQS